MAVRHLEPREHHPDSLGLEPRHLRTPDRLRGLDEMVEERRLEVDPVIDLRPRYHERMARTQWTDGQEHGALLVLPDESSRELALDDAREDRRHQTLGSHWKNLAPTISAPRPHAPRTRRSFVCKPDPLNEKNDPIKASAKCRTGKILPTMSSHCGGFWSGMKMFEMNSSGRIEALTTAGDASEFGITVVTATPSALNTAAPTTTVRANAGRVLVGSVAP